MDHTHPWTSAFGRLRSGQATIRDLRLKLAKMEDMPLEAWKEVASDYQDPQGWLMDTP